MLGLFAEGGSRPALPTYFLLPESRQRAGPYGSRPFASLRADLRRQVLGAVRQNSLRVFDAPFKHVAASQMTMQLHSAVQLRATRGRRRRRGHKGQYRIRDNFFVQLIAAAAISNWS